MIVTASQGILFQPIFLHFWFYNKKRKSVLEPADSDEESKKKRGKVEKDKDEKDKSNYKDLGNMVKNQNPVNDWKVVGSKYKKVFTKEMVDYL